MIDNLLSEKEQYNMDSHKWKYYGTTALKCYVCGVIIYTSDNVKSCSEILMRNILE